MGLARRNLLTAQNSRTMDEKEQLKRKIGELEIELEDAKNLSRARERLLIANIKELNESYNALREKVNDIRERDKKIRDFTEVLTRANRLSALGELAASIAHEIKNPLISIQGFAKRIGQGQEPQKGRRVRQIHRKRGGTALHRPDEAARLLTHGRAEARAPGRQSSRR